MRSPAGWTSISRPSRSGTSADGDRRLPRRHLALAAEVRRDDRGRGRRGHVPRHVRGRLHGRARLARAAGPVGRALRLGGRVHLRPPAAVLRRAWRPSRARSPTSIGARCLVVDRRLGDDRPHLAGRLDQARVAGRALPDRARHRAQGLQLLRLAPRQPRGDGARHVRERAAAQPARARARRAPGRRIFPTARR